MLCLKARAKINWTLDILGVREDGYHLMDMLMQSVSVYDTLWLEPADRLSLEPANAVRPAVEASPSADRMSAAFVSYGPDNLVYRAAELLRAKAGIKLGARMRLAKRIPSGAGMGGGSAGGSQRPGTVNTGGGGGGAYATSNGYAGGSGIVIIRNRR